MKIKKLEKFYPEHEKARNAKLNNVQDIGYFLDKMISNGLLQIPIRHRRRGVNIEKIIQAYFNIDHQKLMDEKEEILKELNK